MHNYELLLQKLDAFIRKYYLNKLLRGALLFIGLLLGFYVFISLAELFLRRGCGLLGIPILYLLR